LLQANRLHFRVVEGIMRHPYRTIGLAIVTVVLLTGCSTANYFRLLLTVKDGDTGKPVEGVTGIIDYTTNAEEQKNDLTIGLSSTGSTNADGQLTHDFMVSPYPSNAPHWYLKLKKEGYEPAVIDIKPNPEPERKRDEKHPLPVVVEMKPLAKKP
jgi:hypothetical protein